MSGPPFRADVVGSFLRPARLKAARERLLGPQTPDRNLGPHDNADLRAIEDDCVREVVAMQERVGLQSATDGEFRRRSWWLDLIMGWDGFSADRAGATEMVWRNAAGETKASSRLWVSGPIRWRESATVRAFAFLKATCKVVPKVTLPAPASAKATTRISMRSGPTWWLRIAPRFGRWSKRARPTSSSTTPALRSYAIHCIAKPCAAGATNPTRCCASMRRR
jgi:methionine synthase II (cobalamin-independent)